MIPRRQPRNKPIMVVWQCHVAATPLLWSPQLVECTGRFSKGVVDLVERCALAAARTGLTTRGRFKLKWLTILSVTLHSLNYNATRRNLRRACEFSNVKMREMEEQAAMGAGEAPIMAQGGGVGEGMGGQ